MAKVYHQKKDPDSPESYDDILAEAYENLKANTSMDAASTTVGEAICGRKYRGGTWFCFIFNMFNQQTGINAVNVYAGSLLAQMQTQGGGDDFPITPVQGGYFIGGANMVFACSTIFFANRTGRKNILIVGQLAMCLLLLVCGLAVKNEWAMVSFVTIVLFVGAF